MAIVLCVLIKQCKITIFCAILCLKYVYETIETMQVEDELVLYQCYDIFYLLINRLLFSPMKVDLHYLEVLNNKVNLLII